MPRTKKKLPPPRPARVPAERVAVAVYMENSLALIGEASKLKTAERERVFAEAAAAEVAENKRRKPGRRPRFEVLREYLESCGAAGAHWHGYGFRRQALHGQEIVEQLEREGWHGDLDGLFEWAVREGLVEKVRSAGAPPPWCRSYGQSFAWATEGAPHVSWWTLRGARQITLSNELGDDASDDERCDRRALLGK